MQATGTHEAMIARKPGQDAVADAVLEYERRFAQRTGAPFAVAFSHARAALAAALRSLPGDGDEVLLSPLTCKVVPLAVLAAGLKPAWLDIRDDSLNLDPAAVAVALSRRTRALLFQRTYGNAAGAAEAVAVARHHGIPVIEDCAQCMPDADAWTADAAVFSNNPGKPLPAGSGGMIVTRNAGLAERLRAERARLPRTSPVQSLRPRFEAWVRNRWLNPSLYWPAFELNRRLDTSYRVRGRETEVRAEITEVSRQIGDAQARAGLHWLEEADGVARHRTRCCGAYAASLVGRPAVGLPCPTGDAPLYFFPVLVDRKAELLSEARRRRIEIIAWPLQAPIYPIRDVRSLGGYGYEAGSCPVAERVAVRLVGLPTHPLVQPRDIERAVELVSDHAAVHARGESAQ